MAPSACFCFLLFIWGVSLFPDIRRVYQYHGAEHKTVFAFESGDPLEIAPVQRYSTYHPRCGTSFLMTVMLISIAFYMLVPFTTFWARFALAHCAAAVDRRRVLRDHPLRRQASRLALRADDRSRPLAAAHHHAASDRTRWRSAPSPRWTKPWLWKKSRAASW